MAILKNDARLFGMDLSEWGDALSAAWQDMWHWPVLAWLHPTVQVRVILADGQVVAYRGQEKPLPLSNKSSIAARFEAVQLPDALLLRQSVVLPRLPLAETQAALTLEAQSRSPFPSNQLQWISRSLKAASPDVQCFELVLTSRALVIAHLDEMRTLLVNTDTQSSPPEVWIPADDGTHLQLPEWGGAKRQKYLRTGFRVNVLMFVASLGLLAAVAATPTMQLRLQAIDAEAQHTALLKQVAPVLQQREAQVKTLEQLQSVRALAGGSVPAIQVLDIVTRALPVDTSVLTLQVHAPETDGKVPRVQITGQTGNTAALMQHLGQLPGIRDVKAPTPAVKPPGAVKESYSIEFTVDSVASGVTTGRP